MKTLSPTLSKWPKSDKDGDKVFDKGPETLVFGTGSSYAKHVERSLFSGFGFRHSFGLRPSTFFRASAFGLRICLAALTLTGTLATGASNETFHTFRKQQIASPFWSQGATLGDFNLD